MNNFNDLQDIPDLSALIQEALQLKSQGIGRELGKGKTLGMIFFNNSLRTRLSTEKAARLLGMEVMSLNAGGDAWEIEFEDGVIMNGSRAEHIKEAAAVLSAYCDIIAIRAFPGLQDREKDEANRILTGFIKYASVPVINLESALGHPLQALADAMTIEELRHIEKPKVVLSWAPHPKALPQSVPNSFLSFMQQLDVDLMVTHPEGYELDPRVIQGTPVCYDQSEALKEADFVYVKNWSSYRNYGKVLVNDSHWTFDEHKLGLTRQAKVMHCLPVRRNVVLTDGVLDGPNSVVIRQAGNRVFAAQAVLKKLLESNYSE